MERFHHLSLCFLATFFSLLVLPVLAQFPFTSDEGEANPDLPVPESVPTDLIAPRITPRDSAADNLARLFNRNLRGIENRQRDIINQLGALPDRPIESFTQNAFGYHSQTNKKRPKEIVIDLGESVAPDGIALFPVTVQDSNGETIFGYGFPKSFEVHFSNEPTFESWDSILFDMGDSPRRYPVYRELSGYEGRYVRIRAIDLWRREKTQAFALSEVMVLKGERNLALDKKVRAKDSRQSGNKWSEKFVNDGSTAFGIPQGNEKSPSIGYRSSTKDNVKSSWVQVDLGESVPIEEIRIILANDPSAIPDPQVLFPYPITVEVSEYEDMVRAETLGRFSTWEITQNGNNPLIIPGKDGYGRFVRIRVSKQKAGPMNFSLAELQVFSENQNIALGKPVRGSHPRKKSNAYREEFLVDGFGSRFNLVSYQSWVSDLEKRVDLDHEFEILESDRLKLVDKTFTRSMIASAGSLIGVLGLSLFFVVQSRVRRRKDLENLRQRIASDLHDDIGSNLSSIALLAELGKTEADEPDLVVEELSEIKLTADKTIESMKDIVWLIRPGEETWKQMMTRFRETASKLLRAHEYSFDETGLMHDDRLPLEFKRDFFLIYKEVLNNIVRHANASEVSILVSQIT